MRPLEALNGGYHAAFAGRGDLRRVAAAVAAVFLRVGQTVAHEESERGGVPALAERE